MPGGVRGLTRHHAGRLGHNAVGWWWLTARASGAERGGELAGGRVAARRVAVQGTQDRGGEGLRDLGVVRGRRERALALASQRELGERCPLPGKSPGQELVDDDAKRVDV